MFAAKPDLCHKRNKGKLQAYPKFLIINVSKHTMTEFPYSSIIWLTQSKYTIIDNEDYESLATFRWYAARNGNNFYAGRDYEDYQIRLHRVIANAPKDKVIDHINGNSLDNRRANLRICANSDNSRNAKLPITNTSGFKGIRAWGSSWQAQIGSGKTRLHLGSFPSKEAAARAYDAKALELYGEFACTNVKLGLLPALAAMGIREEK